MTDLPCSKWCPFLACDGCPFQGGKAPEPQGDTEYDGSGKDERPAASTAGRSEPLHIESTDRSA